MMKRMKTLTRQDMMKEVIRIKGFEDDLTIWFCGVAEDTELPESVVLNAYIVVMATPVLRKDIEE